MTPIATNKQDDTDAQSGADLGLTTSVGDHATHHNDLATAVNVLNEAPLNPDLYGVTWDGTTDDSAAWQACFDAIPATGGEIYARGGAAPSIASGVIMKSKTKLSGAGIGSTVLKLKNSAAGLSTPDWPWSGHRAILINEGAGGAGATDLTIEGIEFDGNVANNVAIEQTFCVGLSGVRRVFVRDCYFHDVRAEGLCLLVNAPALPTPFVENEDVTVQNCILYNCGFIGGGPGAERQGIACISGERIQVRGITANKIAQYAVDFESDIPEEQHRNCVITDITATDVIGGVAMVANSLGQSTDNMISNVTLSDGPTVALTFGVRVGAVRRLIIRGVQSDYVYNGGPIYADAASEDLLIFDVQSVGSQNGGSGPAIDLISTNRVFVQGCSLRQGGGQTYAVRETTAGGPTIVNGNHILDGTTGSVLFTHAGSRVVDATSGGGLKPPVRVAAPINVTVASPGTTIDGVTMSAGPPGDRVLLTAQTTVHQNGLYNWNGSAVPMTRTVDADTAVKLTESLLVTADEGDAGRDSIWTLVTNKPITLGTTSLRFTRVHPPYTVSSHKVGNDFQPTSSKLENLPRDTIDLTNQAALTTQIVRVFPAGVLRAGDSLAAINLQVGTTASASITNSWGGIARLSDRMVLAISATSTATTAANTLKTFTFTSAYTADKDEVLVGFVMYQATTVPSLFGINHGNASIITQAPVISGTSNTGATTPVAVGATLTAFTADTEMVYAFFT